MIPQYGRRIRDSDVDGFAKVPNWLLKQTEISNGAKLVYGRLLQYIGNNEYCYPKQKLLSVELGMSLSRLKVHLSQLIELGLIWTAPDRDRISNDYGLLTHEWMDGKPLDKQRLTNAVGSPEMGYSPEMGDQDSPKTGERGSPDPGDPIMNRSGLKDHPKQNKVSGEVNLVNNLFTLPEPYNTPELTAAWNKWLQYRQEIRKKITPTAAKQHIAFLEAWGAEKWIAAIDLSISSGWQGLFEPKATTSKSASGFVLQKERERVETQIQAIQRETQEYSWLNTPERQEELKKLKARRADLEAKIAKVL